MKAQCDAPAETAHSEQSSTKPDVRRSKRSQLPVKTNIRAGVENTKHAAKVTVPDIKLG
ncbi:MAG: hypothetical protein JNK04_06075 [Myxococcales bacterium]|nr:hypothetical protein [Myxococcales bacterium]